MSSLTEFVVYYVNKQKRPPINRPAAVLFGNDWKSVGESPVKLDNKFGTISAILNNGRPMLSDAVQVKHSNDLLIIKAKSNSKITIYGERGDGIQIGSNSVIKIAGILQVMRNGEIETMDGGRHSVQCDSDNTKFIICDDNKVLMIEGDTNSIDEEAHLDKQGEGAPGTEQGKGPFTSTPFPKTGSTQKKETQDKDSKDDRGREIGGNLLDISAIDLFSSFTDFVIYYKRSSVKILSAILVGNDWSRIDPKRSRKRIGDGWLWVQLNTDESLGAHHIKQSKDQVCVDARVGSYMYVYGENGDGLRVGPHSYLILAGDVHVSNRGRLGAGRHTVMAAKGNLTIIFGDFNSIKLIASSFLVDGEAHAQESGDGRGTDNRGQRIMDRQKIEGRVHYQERQLSSRNLLNRGVGRAQALRNIQDNRRTAQIKTSDQQKNISDISPKLVGRGQTWLSMTMKNELDRLDRGVGRAQALRNIRAFIQDTSKMSLTMPQQQQRNISQISPRLLGRGQRWRSISSGTHVKKSDRRVGRGQAVRNIRSYIQDHQKSVSPRLLGRGRAWRSISARRKSGNDVRLSGNVVPRRNRTLERLQRYNRSMRRSGRSDSQVDRQPFSSGFKVSSKVYDQKSAEEVKRMASRKSEQRIGSLTIASHLTVPEPTIKDFSEMKDKPKDYPSIVEYLLYSCGSDGRTYPIGHVIGYIYGQTINTKILEMIPKTVTDRVAVRVVVYDKSDRDMTEDKDSIGVGDVTEIKSLNGAKIYIYDEQCDGFVLGFGSELKLSAKPYKLVDDRQIPLNPINVERELMNSKVGDSFHFVLSDHKVIAFEPI